MARGMPSMMALLGMLAVAGYKNRDKISDMLSDAKTGMAGNPNQGQLPPGQQANTSSGGLLEELGGLFGGSSAGGTLSDGIGELQERFRQSGRQQTADSWIGNGPNEPMDAEGLHQTLGEDTVRELAAKTGLSEREVVERLSASLPDTVNRFSPEGRVPTRDEASRWQ